MTPRAAPPDAAMLPCPDCGEEQVHDVLHAQGAAGSQHATVRCRECQRVHRAVMEPLRYVTVPVIISQQETSQRTTVELPEDELLEVGDEMVAADQEVKLTAIDRRDGKRVRKAPASQVATLWVVHFEEVLVKVSVNMGKKTIAKAVPVSPRDSFTIGDVFDLDKLRVVVHRIRTDEQTLSRGSAEAWEIRRIFARPLHLTYQERAERRRELGLPEPKPRARDRPGSPGYALRHQPPPGVSVRGARREPPAGARERPPARRPPPSAAPGRRPPPRDRPPARSRRPDRDPRPPPRGRRRGT